MSMNNGTATRTIGWDSIESSVDAFELKPHDYDTVDKMAQPKPYDDFDALDHISAMLKRAKRHKNDLVRLNAEYGLDNGAFERCLNKIATQTVESIGFLTGGPFRTGKPDRPA